MLKLAEFGIIYITSQLHAKMISSLSHLVIILNSFPKSLSSSLG